MCVGRLSWKVERASESDVYIIITTQTGEIEHELYGLLQGHYALDGSKLRTCFSVSTSACSGSPDRPPWPTAIRISMSMSIRLAYVGSASGSGREPQLVVFSSRKLQQVRARAK